ncbi:MAG: hypothetical protein ACOX5W_04510 [Bacillota bacterium]|jgi:hypothetical protein
MSLPKEELYRLVARLPEQNIERAKKYLEKLVERVQPESAVIPRPGSSPFYIDPFCTTCSTPLVLADLLDNPNTDETKTWHDEFICPSCQDTIYLDWPENEIAALSKEQRRKGGVSWDELKRELDL